MINCRDEDDAEADASAKERLRWLGVFFRFIGLRPNRRLRTRNIFVKPFPVSQERDGITQIKPTPGIVGAGQSVRGWLSLESRT